MQRDSLEKLIVENRESFDQAVPGLKVWAGIDKQLNKRMAKRLTLWRSVRVAAAVAALLFIGGLGGHYLGSTANSEPTAHLEEMAPEYAEMANYYEQQIDQRVQRLASYQQGDMVLEDFEHLDNAMEELKQDLLDAPKGQEEQIIESLIRSYQTKVHILERVLERIQTNDPQYKNPEGDEITI